MPNSDPQYGVPTATGTLQGVATFGWNGSAWVADAPSGSTVIASGSINAGGFTPRVTGSVIRPSDATQYAIGDMICPTGSPGVPISFSVARAVGGSGRITGIRCVVSAASGTIVLPAFDLLLFRPEANIPFAAASYPIDNAALSVSAAAMAELVAIFPLSATGWRNQAGGATAAGTGIYQSATLSSGRPYAPFNLTSCGGQVVLGLLQAQNTWNPGAVVNTISIALDVDQD
jgi:hypothetical protein